MGVFDHTWRLRPACPAKQGRPVGPEVSLQARVAAGLVMLTTSVEVPAFPSVTLSSILPSIHAFHRLLLSTSCVLGSTPGVRGIW